MSNTTEAEREAAWEADRAKPRFHHIIHETDGKLSRESYVYSTLAGSVELWRTPERTEKRYSTTGYYGGVEIHSATQLYDFAPEVSHTNCKYTPTGKCWHDGSSLAFDQFENAFASRDYIKAELKEWHASHFTPTEETK
jgi:hypothetical protein